MDNPILEKQKQFVCNCYINAYLAQLYPEFDNSIPDDIYEQVCNEILCSEEFVFYLLNNMHALVYDRSYSEYIKEKFLSTLN
jgi:hypothetical protein